MSLAFKGNLPAPRAWARRALEPCSVAEEIESKTNPNNWRLATKGEATLLIGDFCEALQLYHAGAATRPDPWQLESKSLQVLETARQLKNEQVAEALAQNFNKTLA